MARLRLTLFLCSAALLVGSAVSCARLHHSSKAQHAIKSPQAKHKHVEIDKRFAQSGTIVLSAQMPKLSVNASQNQRVMAPLIGYIPPSNGFLPADNETWLELDRKTNKISLFKGKKIVKQLEVEGSISLTPGVYPIQEKQKRPLWYAPDTYFSKRQLDVPPVGDSLRYRKGALGPYALFLTNTYPIHSGALWSEDVGGLKIARAELSAIYYMIPIGTSVVVK